VTAVRHVAALFVGAAVALASLAAHRSLFPLGLLVALASTYAVAWWLLRSLHPRTAVSYVVGWLVVLAVVVSGRPEGDYLLGSDLDGYALLVGSLGLVVVGIVSFAGGRASST
jgi:hypothetical protein